jgi:transcriptional regulator with XRE-family HTH domain
MPWVPIKGALTRLREEAGYSVRALAKAAKLDWKTVAALEEGIGFPLDSTVEAIQKALDIKPNDKRVEKQFVQWVAAGTSPGGVPLPPTPPPKPPSESSVITAPDTQQSKREALLKKDKPYIVLGKHEYQVLGYNRQKKIEFNYALMVDEEFAVCGWIRDFRHIPDDVGQFIRAAPQGHGPAYFKIRREIPELGLQGYPEPFDQTVYVPSTKHGLMLQAIHDNRQEVAIVARVVVAPSSVRFPTFDQSKPLQPFALVAKTVIADPFEIRYR